MSHPRTIVAIVAVAVLAVGCDRGAGNGSSGPSATAPTSQTTDLETTARPTTDAPRPGPTAPEAPANAPRKQAGLFFPQVPEPGGDSPSALGGGKLFVKNGCVYMGSRRHADVVVWPHGYSLAKDAGQIRVLNENGEAVARVGGQVRMGGGEITQGEAGPTPEAARKAFEEKRGELGVPDRCRGPLWVSSGVTTKLEG